MARSSHASGNAVSRLAARLGELAGAPVELERPGDPAHGDYATNVALRTAPQHKRPPRELAADLAEQAAQLDEIERAEVAGPGFLNLWVTNAWLAAALGEIDAEYGAGDPDERQKIQVELISANPAGPLTVGSARNGAYGDSVARVLDVRGQRGRARVLLQRHRPPGRPVPRVRRGAPAWGGAARRRLPGRVHQRARRAARRSRPAHARGDPPRGRASSGFTWTRGAIRARSKRECPTCCQRSIPMRPKGRSGRERAATATTRTARWCGPPTGRTSISPRMSRTCATSSSAGSTARSTCSAPITTATSGD